MNLMQEIKVLNLDAIPDDTIITATGEGGRVILNKAQLFAKLCRRKNKRPAPPPKATRTKADKA